MKNRRVTTQIKNTLALPRSAQATATLLQNLSTVFSKLFADENFVTLLQAESRTTIPEYLKAALHEGETWHDIT